MGLYLDLSTGRGYTQTTIQKNFLPESGDGRRRGGWQGQWCRGRVEREGGKWVCKYISCCKERFLPTYVDLLSRG